MGARGSRRNVPRATIHKQILDAAEANPEASLEVLANEVPAATIDLVERVLNEYGDPSNAEGETSGNDDEPSSERTPDELGNHPTSDEDSEGHDGHRSTDDQDDPIPTGENAGDDPSDVTASLEEAESTDDKPMSDESTLPDPDEVTEEQRAVLRAIEARPEATQAELAREVDVSAATVNRRVNKIDGFDWEDRARIAEELLPDTPREPMGEGVADVTAAGPATSTESTPTRTRDRNAGVSATKESNGTDPGASDTASRVATLEQRVARLESLGQGSSGREKASAPLEDTELAAKLVRTCVASEEFNDEEELRVIESRFNG